MKFISVLLLLLILICCKSKNEPYTIFDAKGHKVKEVFGEMDSIVYYKRDSLLSFKKRNDGLYHAKIFLNGNLNSEGAGQLKKNNFLRTGWWNSYQADTVSQNEYLIIQGEDYLNQSKTYYLDRLLDEKSLYFTTEITENNKDSLIVQFNFYPPKTETRNNYLCIIQDDFDGFDNLYQSRIDTIPMLYETPLWKIVILKDKYTKEHLKGFFYSIQYTEEKKGDETLVIREGSNHFFQIELEK